MATQTSSPAPTDGNRRKSGRAVRKPEQFIEESYEGSLLSNRPAKRKRAPNAEATSDVEDEESSSDSDSSVEEVQPRSKAKKSAAKDAKRTKTLDSRTTLAFRSPKGKTGSKAKVRKARARQSQAHQEGLYAEVFGRGDSGADAAAQWYQRYEADNVEGMCEMVNFVLQCTGCTSKVTTHDIQDADNVPNRLGDLQEEYQGAAMTEYPLISKVKDLAAFREVLVEFFAALIKTMHSNASLYDDEILFENLQLWVDTMSSAGIRAFRHTATLISLSMSTAMCEIARDLESTISTSRRQAEAEQKKKKVNQARVKSMLEKIEQEEARVGAVETILRDEFDVVYVHRYRDVDPKIRVECVTAIGSWMLVYRKMFMEGQYLRYLGWLLSDTSAPTRAEVLKQLKLLYAEQDSFASLHAFTDRFRPRMVEIATRDAEPTVRVHAIQLLNDLLFAELLEAEETDIIGGLIFDAEPRVRDQAAKFFLGQLSNVYVVTCDAVIGMEDSTLPESVELEDYESPSQGWLYYKFLASHLQMYAGVEDEVQDNRPANFVTNSANTRFSLAAEAIYPYFEQLRNWQFLAGYLLFDHSSIPNGEGNNPNAEAEETYKLEDGEDVILLEVLATAVKLYLTKIAEGQAEGRRKGRQTQVSKDEIIEKQETTARHLTVIIPQLLSKYGSLPAAVTSILRLQHLLDLDIISELQEGEKTCADLLDDINKQFMTHSDRSVLSEASLALVKAKKAEPAKDAVDLKMQEMWDETLGQLQSLARGPKSGGSFTAGQLEQATNAVSRIYHLASISDCTAVFESEITAPSKKQKGRAGVVSLELLFQFCERDTTGDAEDADTNQWKDELTTAVVKTLLFYFMWKILAVRNAISTSNFRLLESSLLASISTAADKFVQRLFKIAQPSLPLDPLRLLALSTTIDLFTLFSTLRHAKSDRESETIPAAVRGRLDDLIAKIPDPLQSLTMATHDRLETNFAKKSHRKLEVKGKPDRVETNSPAPDAPPVDSEDEEEEDYAEDEDDGAVEDGLGTGRDAKKAATLLAEQSLCEFTGKLVLAIMGGVMDMSHKERVLRNRTKLGPNYKEVLNFLDDGKKKSKSKVVEKAKGQAVTEKTKEKSKGRETRSDAEEDVDIVQNEENGHEDGLEEEVEDGVEEDAEEEVNGADAVDEDEIMGD